MLHQYGLARTNRIISIRPQQSEITYALSTLPGHSGSPVIANGRIVAIHNGGGRKDEQFNVGRLVTYDFLHRLEEWRE